MVRASYNMNDVIDQYLAGLLLAGVATDNVLYSDTTAVTPTSANAYDYLVDLGVKLSECNVPMYGRWVVVPPWYHGLLLKDQRFVGNGTATTRRCSRAAWWVRPQGSRSTCPTMCPTPAAPSTRSSPGTNAAGRLRRAAGGAGGVPGGEEFLRRGEGAPRLRR